MVISLADGEGIAPTRACAPLGFQDRGIAALPTIRKMVRVERIALPTSWFQARPSAADLHPDKMALAEGLSPSSPVLEAPRSK